MHLEWRVAQARRRLCAGEATNRFHGMILNHGPPEISEAFRLIDDESPGKRICTRSEGCSGFSSWTVLHFILLQSGLFMRLAVQSVEMGAVEHWGSFPSR